MSVVVDPAEVAGSDPFVMIDSVKPIVVEPGHGAIRTAKLKLAALCYSQVDPRKGHADVAGRRSIFRPPHGQPWHRFRAAVVVEDLCGRKALPHSADLGLWERSAGKVDADD